MDVPPPAPRGWYPGPDGIQRYWDGYQWLEIAPPEIPIVAPTAPTRPRTSIRTVATLGLAAIVLAGSVVGGFAWKASYDAQQAEIAVQEAKAKEDRRDRDYLAALAASGLIENFASDAEAIAHAKAVCITLEAGGKQRGTPADLEAVTAYCPQFATGFDVLATKTIIGVFSLQDFSLTGIAEGAGNSCTGINGYSDIHKGTQVTVRDGRGDFLASSELKKGEGNDAICDFPFEITLSEGADTYVFTVSRRGDLHFTWEDLTRRPLIRLYLNR